MGRRASSTYRASPQRTRGTLPPTLYANRIVSSRSTAQLIQSLQKIAYGPSKAALDSLTITLANHFARSKVRIRCNGIAPGAFVSEMVPSDSVHSLKDTAMPGCVAPIPMGRAGTYVVDHLKSRSCSNPRHRDVEMARTAVYLATSDYTNGVILLVDGGNSLVNP